MGKLRIVGLGPTNEKDLTAKAMEAIGDDSQKFLRTEEHDAVAYFRSHHIPYNSYDYLYESMGDFDSIYRAIAEDLWERSKDTDISYFVPGHPLIAEKTVVYLLEKDPSIEIVDGLSFMEPVLTAVKRDPVDGMKIINGDDFSDLDLDIHVDTIVTQVYNQRIVRELKLAIAELYGDEHAVFVLSHAGHETKAFCEKRLVYLLDRFDDYGYETSLYIPRIEAQKDVRDIVRLIRRLRGPDGCPWDGKQTHESMKTHLIEEAYEAAYAIDCKDTFAMEEELGDVLFQVMFHAELAAEEGTFSLASIVESLVEKMIRRHPHVFQNGVSDWEGMKAQERGSRTLSQKIRHYEGLPALLRGQKTLRLVADDSFILDSFEEMDEDRGRIVKGLVNVLIDAEKSGIDAESALASALGQIADVLSEREGNEHENL
ncbi:MAG: MazG nucleotide pyrophosphohydrolase domain-containing protein [Peptoniphilus sp.]|nr:MazG nucleotide pyrophosphohydrolase domain-containing protein [Peptoniphilus sp.]MDY3117969.1 MazG nucleotide pyrophosphohydrolase domain-containing protein [Peptoniphilus sp.]